MRKGTKIIKEAVKEAIIVEGKNDTWAVLKAAGGKTIETRGTAMPAEALRLIDRAYRECGIIIFTDPDRAGNRIRRTLAAKYPGAKHAFLPREKAEKNGDIGVENADPVHILEALDKARCTREAEETEFTMEDMSRYGLTGAEGSRQKREKLGDMLSIGYGNTKAFLRRLNQFGINRKEFTDALEEIK